MPYGAGVPGTVAIETVRSEVLVGNPLGDPSERRVPVWLPPSYVASPGRRYPTLYWLQGYGGDGRSLLHGSPWQEGLPDRLDRLVASGDMGEVIVVAPDCFTRFGGSQYVDSPATGAYETHLTRELVPEIDRRFRTIPLRAARGIAGKSSGGFGALTLGMRHPNLFSAVACHAGDAYFELSVIPVFAAAARTLRRHGGIDGFLAHFDAAPVKKGDDFTTMMTLADAACYSPDAGRPHGFALPFDIETGEIDQAQWKRWKAWDPVETVAQHADALRALSLLYIDAGTRDEYALDLAARILVKRLRELGIACEHHEFDDGHSGTQYRYDVSLPLLATALGAAPQ